MKRLRLALPPALVALLLVSASAFAADGAADTVEGKMQEAGAATKRGLDTAGEATGEALEKAMDATGRGVGTAIEKTGEGLNAAGDAMTGKSEED